MLSEVVYKHLYIFNGACIAHIDCYIIYELVHLFEGVVVNHSHMTLNDILEAVVYYNICSRIR